MKMAGASRFMRHWEWLNRKWARGICCVSLVIVVIAASFGRTAAQQPARDVAKESARPTRDWVRDAVIYEIYPRAFSAQGNFNGITAQLDRLKELGVTILWLMPIHPIGQEKKKGTIGSPYAVRDYYAINPDYGTKDDLKRLISEAHRRGMKMVIDIVANHTSWDSVMMKWPDFYQHDAGGQVTYPHDWTDVAALNYDNPKLRQYMTDMLKYWIREFDLDGFRCDVAAEVPTVFWEHARAALEQIKPDILMLAEANKEELLLQAFDTDYDWPLLHGLEDVIWGRKPATELRRVWHDERNRFPSGALHLSISDDHDEQRAIAQFGKRGALAASAFTFTMDGIPLLYNGMEVGDTTESGAPALFEKLPIYWPTAERRREFPAFYKQIIALRRSSNALRRGSLEWLKNSDESRVVSYSRRHENEAVVVVINFSNQPFSGSIDGADGGAFQEITPLLGPPGRDGANPVTLSSISIEPWGFRIFRRMLR
jgi:glycosidase